MKSNATTIAQYLEQLPEERREAIEAVIPGHSLTREMCHNIVSRMRTTTIRELKHATSAVLSWVEGGESVEVRRHNRLVAILSPPNRRNRIVRPDFEERLRAIYGLAKLAQTGTDLIAESRGES